MIKKKILIADEDPYILMMTKSRLEANGYEVLTTSKVSEAVKMANRSRPDLILLDVILPTMEGRDACFELSSGETTRDIPILVFTASSRKDVEAACLKAGAKAVITKPFDSSELLSLVKKAFDPNSKWRKSEDTDS